MSALIDALRALTLPRDLSAEEAESAVAEALGGRVPEATLGAFLTALRLKGETADELAGAVLAVRSRVDNLGLVAPSTGLIDTCGTGGDCANTVNVSTAAAIVVAACGVPVAKHGNRAASGNSGSAEVLAELGIAIEAAIPVVNRCLAELGITFLFAPRFHPGLKALALVRRQLPFRTLMNLVGPLANPGRPEFQLVGVAGEPQARLVADALARLGIRRAMVVTGSDGLDEVSLAGPTRAWVIERKEEVGPGPVTVVERIWRAEDFGLGRVTVDDLRVSGPSDSAARIGHFLGGEPGPVRDTVLANAAAALWVVAPGPMTDCVQRAAEAVDSGQAGKLLARWRLLSHETA